MKTYWWICEECGRKTKQPRISKYRWLCFDCYRKSLAMMPIDIPRILLNEALSKTYEVKGYITKQGCVRAKTICFPQVLIGHKFKIQLVKDGK